MPPRPFFSFIVSSVSAERPTECVLSARSRKRPGALPCDLPVDPICCVVMNTRPGHGHGARPSLGPPPRRTRLRLRSRLILLVPMLLAFAGCMIGPNYQQPKVSVSPNWGETADRRVSTESTTYRDWWRAFNDPALDRLVALAATRSSPPRRRPASTASPARASKGPWPARRW